MNILTAKNGQKTVQINGFFLHSSYNPQAEAKRFVENIALPFDCKFILITEPALSYVVDFFKEKFPTKKIFCIRYTNDFNDYNKNFDDVINFYEHKNNFNDFLLNKFGEVNIFKVFFLKWEPSSKAFNEIDEKVWKEIKKSLELAKTLLITRQYFEKKWLLNSINFINHTKKICTLKKINKPILIIASGPSLKPLLEFLPKIKDNFFIICLSSAISVLKKNKIEPNLYLSTDGGFWAGQHLKKILKQNNIPLALSLESFCQKNILEKSKILVLNYEDGISSDFINYFKIKNIKVKRNGTVSGTALNLALDFSDEEIYFAGLDLAENKNFSHTQPNEIERNNCLNENKIFSQEKRIFQSKQNNKSLEIYQKWFSTNNFENRKIFRIINPEYKMNSLGKIKDISVFDFIKNIKSNKTSQNYFNEFYFENINKKELKDFLLKKLNEQKTLEQIFPLDFISISHSPNDKILQKNLEEKKENLISKILSLCS